MIRWQSETTDDLFPGALYTGCVEPVSRIEDIWNQAKAFVRQQWANLTSFQDVMTAFEQFLAGRVFDFPKLHRYCPDLQMT